MDNNVPSDFDATMDRIKRVTGCRTQSKLAEFLGIRQSVVTYMKKRKNIPSDWLLILWRKKGVNPDWILTGEGPKEFQHTTAQEAGIAGARDTQVARSLKHYPTEELLTEVIRRVAKMWRNGMREV